MCVRVCVRACVRKTQRERGVEARLFWSSGRVPGAEAGSARAASDWDPQQVSRSYGGGREQAPRPTSKGGARSIQPPANLVQMPAPVKGSSGGFSGRFPAILLPLPPSLPPPHLYLDAAKDAGQQQDPLSVGGGGILLANGFQCKRHEGQSVNHLPFR